MENLFEKQSEIVITCPKGVSPYLKAETEALGFQALEIIAGARVNGTLNDTIKLNLKLRTGHRVLYLLKRFPCPGPEELYKGVYEIPWEDIIDENGYVSVSSSVDNPNITNWQFANLKCKDAIVDKIAAIKNKRPDSGPAMDKTVVFIYWKGDECCVYIDTSGEALAKRGWRRIPLAAPMQETLAAAILAATGYTGEQNIINPMCGSGTIAIEAALIAANIPAGMLRDNFGFMHVKGYSPDAWQATLKEAKNKIKNTLSIKIFASDFDPSAISAAKTNARLAGVEKFIDFTVCDYKDTPLPDTKGIIILNPEYGIRLGETSALEKTYEEIGTFLKQRCQGHTGYVFSGNRELLKKIKLKPKRRIIFFNGNIECRLNEYPIHL